MKKLQVLIIALFCMMCSINCASAKDSTPRYKMYQTDNIHILLKLDTATGKVWMVQYGTGDNIGMTVSVDSTSLLIEGAEEVAGRYELYPTKNMYNFIQIDTKQGNTYQVQWSVEPSNRMRVPIY